MNVTLQKGIHYTYISEMLLELRSFSLSSNNMYIIPLYYDANNYVKEFFNMQFSHILHASRVYVYVDIYTKGIVRLFVYVCILLCNYS